MVLVAALMVFGVTFGSLPEFERLEGPIWTSPSVLESHDKMAWAGKYVKIKWEASMTTTHREDWGHIYAYHGEVLVIYSTIIPSDRLYIRRTPRPA